MITNACKCHVAYKNTKLSYRTVLCHRQRVINDGVDAHCDKLTMVDVPLEKNSKIGQVKSMRQGSRSLRYWNSVMNNVASMPKTGPIP